MNMDFLGGISVSNSAFLNGMKIRYLRMIPFSRQLEVYCAFLVAVVGLTFIASHRERVPARDLSNCGAK
jgi:hypothetical protein